MKKWKCTVCGYIHTGDEPPEECPVCGAKRSEFVEITGAVDSPSAGEADILGEGPAATETAGAQAAKTRAPGLFSRVTDLMLKNHLHPIAVHTPNGIVPAAVVFLLLAMVLQRDSFELAAFYNIIFVLLVMPVVLFSGFIEWRKHYQGARTMLFILKIVCGIVVLFSLLFLVAWRIKDPAVASPDSPVRWTYLLVHAVPLAAVGLAGHLGGKLVFGRKAG
jgi:uncharacterized membrane protein/rubredoxin